MDLPKICLTCNLYIRCCGCGTGDCDAGYKKYTTDMSEPVKHGSPGDEYGDICWVEKEDKDPWLIARVEKILKGPVNGPADKEEICKSEI